MSSFSRNGLLLFSIDDELRYTGFNKSYADWVKQRFDSEPKVGQEIIVVEGSDLVRESLKKELKNGSSTLETDCSKLFGELDFHEYNLNKIGDASFLTLCFRKGGIQKYFSSDSPFFDLSKDLFSVTGFDNYFIELNKAWEDVLGYSLQELKSRPFYEFLHPEDLMKIQEMQKQNHQPEVIKVVNRYRKKYGGYVWLEWNATIDYEDELSYAVARDVTELQNNEIRLENLANSVPGALLQYQVFPDGSDAVPYISEQVQELWEVTREEAIKNTSSLWNAILDADLRGVRASIMRSAQELSFWDYSWRITTKSGKIRWLNGRGYPRKLIDGSILWDTLILDNTRLKETEQDLVNTNQRMQLATKASKLGVWELDPDANELIWNQGMHEIYEVPEADFNNSVEVPLSYIHPDDVKGIDDAMEHLLEGGTLTNYRFRIITASGKTKYLAASSSILRNEDNEVTKLIGVNEDITDFINKEKELEESITQKETLFRELHHRIKNNLNLVSSLLYVKSKAVNDKSLLDFVKEINGRIISISKTHDQLLKLEEVDQLYSESYLTDLVRTLCATYSEVPEHYQLSLQVENHKMPVDDMLVLGLIANEIVSNILKHAYPSDEGGPIDVSFHKIDGTYKLEISDMGVGKEEDFAVSEESVGLHLIELLTMQLKGTLQREFDGGVKYLISYSKKRN